jgi:hypothetical protein
MLAERSVSSHYQPSHSSALAATTCSHPRQPTAQAKPPHHNSQTHSNPKRFLFDPSMCNVPVGSVQNTKHPLPVHPETLDTQCRGLDQSIMWNAFPFPSLEEIFTFRYNQCPLGQSSARIFSSFQVFSSRFPRLDLWCHTPTNLQEDLRRCGQSRWQQLPILARPCRAI